MVCLLQIQLPGLKRFSDFKEFAAIVECKSSKGNQMLRAMEPPRHDAFEPDRLPDPNQQLKARRALKDLSNWVRDILHRYARDPVSDVTDLNELAEYFGDEDEQKSDSSGEEINPAGKIAIRAQPLKKKSRNLLQENDQPGDEGGGEGEGVGGTGDKHNGSGSKNGITGKGGSGSGGSLKDPVQLLNVRQRNNEGSKRTLFLTPNITGRITIQLYEAGADVDNQLSILSTSLGTLNNNNIENINAEAGTRIKLDIELDNDSYGSVKVLAHEV
ncbi:MAG: hypothetical protein U5P41_15570 [Gammaproteobacteria bacterium]|nr:hypothetical protein [Gammaproteobacteria bacterium]